MLRTEVEYANAIMTISQLKVAKANYARIYIYLIFASTADFQVPYTYISGYFS